MSEIDEHYGRGLTDALEIQQRMNELNNVVAKHIEMVFSRSLTVRQGDLPTHKLSDHKMPQSPS